MSIALLAKAIAVFSTQSLSTHSQMWHYFCPNLCGSAPKGPRCVKKLQFFLQIKLLSFCTRIEPKLKNLQKRSKLKKIVENACFLTCFQIFFNLSSILAHQTSLSLWHIFWHPWGPWRRIHIEDVMVLVFVFKFFWVLSGAPYIFFQIIQNKAWSHLCWFM